MPLPRTHFFACATLALALLATAACSTAPSPAPVLGEAYAGPASLPLHADIDLKSAVVATAHHGDHLDILGQRRRWYRVRTPSGQEGWTSDRELLDPGQMKRLRALTAETASLPSQGKATVFVPINVHIEPNRQATSFIQVQPKETFDVVAHRVVQRGPSPRRELLPARPKPAPKKSKSKEKEKDKSTVPPPPSPAPPPLPPDWLELSKSDLPEPDANLPPTPTDDFTLIRTAQGQSGWILTNAVYMQIPDEVAQYAEGHRITAYFPIGATQDKEESKPIWLWTTSEHLGAPYDFDGYRVFTWNLRKHRYETAFVQRRETGYFPVLINEAARDGRFSVCVERKGQRVRREFMMIGNSVRLAGEKSCEAPKPVEEVPQTTFSLNLLLDQQKAAVAKTTGFFDNLRARWNKLLGRK